jgi:hypothetical protein
VHKITASLQADFLVNEKYTFEIGGKSKTRKQLKEIPNSFVAADNIEVGNGKTIPLWLFGFLY